MPLHAIVSYDATPLDRDGLALAGLLRDAGAQLTLAYIRHAPEDRADRELIADVAAEGRLRDGVQRLGGEGAALRVVSDPSTAHGLGTLAGALDAEVIVCASESGTAERRVGIGRVARALLENGSAAVALAPAGYAVARAHGGGGLRRIGILPGTADEAAIETAYALAECHDATVVAAGHGVDLLVAGSRPEAAEGRVLLSACAAGAVEEARAPVLVTARGVALDFETLVTV